VSAPRHTPGPWTTDPEFDQVWCSERSRRVANCDHKNGIHRLPQVERFANMRLIAAAPELADALLALIPWAEGNHHGQLRCDCDRCSAVAEANAALKKAGVL
jgi:hypothetical protein